MHPNSRHKPRLIVGFDMDDVVLDNADAKITIAKKLGFHLKKRHTPYEIIRTILPQSVLEELQGILFDNHEIVLSTPLVRGVKTVLASLTTKKIPYYLISRRKRPEIAVSVLKKHAVWPKYFNENNSFFVGSIDGKNEKTAELGITHYIDDEVRVITALGRVPNRFLFDRFNAFDKSNEYVKIKSWSEFKRYMKLT